MVLSQPEQLQIQLPLEAVATICRQYGVSELAIFGSALRDDFDPERSDLDVLVRFLDNDAGPWMSKFVDLERDLASLLGRKVDLVDWNGMLQSTNPYRKGHILKTARTVYVA